LKENQQSLCQVIHLAIMLTAWDLVDLQAHLEAAKQAF
jgi:hypothetical protein